jgi:hypothetical protein
VNPFNGIERNVNSFLPETMYWNENPFNGIESLAVTTALHLTHFTLVLGIHSMELKGASLGWGY